ncbi:hypothetical protein QR98_0059810 [Sarcoptes scabiei]|uniref:Uncharacterized protein n=1 Tax=Sarcoptes scabiei TaxID=52283 RepID=A0A132A9A9_SARSC|nr:hypothetical protein QR98_0059810 [Sarcoptes scabiei]
MDRLDKISRESIEEFMRITEADFDTANEYLNRFGWQTVEAINQYFEVMFQENQDQEEQSQQQSTDLAKRHHEREN